jgi:hypothetical protein
MMKQSYHDDENHNENENCDDLDAFDDDHPSKHPRLHPSLDNSTATAAPKEFLPFAGMRWASRPEAVTATLTFFAGQDRCGKIMSNSSGKRVEVACKESVIKAPPIAKDKVKVQGRSGVIKAIDSRGSAEVMFDDGDIMFDDVSNVSLADITLTKPRIKVDSNAACQMRVVLVRSNKTEHSALPWSVSLNASQLKHSTMCGGQAQYTCRTISQLEAFTSAVAGNKTVSTLALEEALEPHGIKIAKSTLHRAKNAAARTDAAAYEASFKSLIAWQDKFNEDQSHGHAEVRLDEQGHFVGMTVCYRSMLELCSVSPIQVSATDMLHSEHKRYQGVHWYLIGYDAENHEAICGWGLGPMEDAQTYEAHFNAIFKMQPLGAPAEPSISAKGWMNDEGHVQIADRMKDIPIAQNNCIPLASKQSCVLHIIDDMQQDKRVVNSWHGSQVCDIVNAKHATDAEKAFAQLKASSPSAEAHLRGIPTEDYCHWAVGSTAAVHGKNMSNLAESANNQYLSALEETPLDAADKVSILVMEKPYDWLQHARVRREMGEQLTAYAAGLIEEQDQQSRFYSVAMSTDTIGYVTSTRGKRCRYLVNVGRGTCQCNYPFQYKLPCRHLIAAAKKQKLLAGANAKAWYGQTVHKGYFLDVYIAALERIAEVTRVKLVDLHGLDQCDDILPSIPVAQAERPRKRSIKSNGEVGGDAARPSGKQYKCSRCGELGHNAATCRKRA